MKIFNLFIFTRKQFNNILCKCRKDTIDIAEVIDRKSTWSAINPVIHSLKELRKNTWDVERVDHAIEWLKDNFEVKDDD